MNNIGAVLIRVMASRVGFHSTHVESTFIFIVTFFLSFANSGLFSAYTRLGAKFFSISFYDLFGAMILTSTLTTNFMPYLGVLLDLLINKCCRKRARSQNQFQIERKNAQILNTIFVVFLYGFGIPLLFLYCVVPLLFLSIADKLLLVYWFKPVPLHSDLFERIFL